MKISQLWSIDTVYAQQLSPEAQCGIDYPTNFVEYKFNQCMCQDPLGSTTTVKCSALTPSGTCEIKYKDLFTKVNDNGQCLCGETNKDGSEILCSSLPSNTLNQKLCGLEKPLRDTKSEACIACPHGLTDDGKECLANNYGNVGLNCSAEDIIHNTCTWNINQTLGIKAANPIPNPELLVQDIVLASTSFLGTGLFIGLLVIGFKAVVQGGSGSEDQMAKIKSGVVNLLIGAALIMASYTIIRLVQYVARGY